MIANPEKFYALIIRKDQTNTSGENFNIQGKTIKSDETVKLLNFEHHISEPLQESCITTQCFEETQTIYWL